MVFTFFDARSTLALYTYCNIGGSHSGAAAAAAEDASLLGCDAVSLGS